MKFMKGIEIKKGMNNRIIVIFPYNLSYVEKVKTIKGHRFYPEEKYWSFPDEDGVTKEIVTIFDEEKITIDPFYKVCG